MWRKAATGEAGRRIFRGMGTVFLKKVGDLWTVKAARVNGASTTEQEGKQRAGIESSFLREKKRVRYGKKKGGRRQESLKNRLIEHR